MWKLSLPWWEFVLRATVVYLFLVVLLRITGKRQIGQMSPFDLVLLLVLSNAVQNSMNGGDNTVTAGVILALTLVSCNLVINLVSTRSKSVEHLLEGEPCVLIYDGHLAKSNMDREGVSMTELEGAMRAAGIEKVEQVHLATMEINGQITLVRNDSPQKGPPRPYRTAHSLRRKGRRSGFGV